MSRSSRVGVVACLLLAVLLAACGSLMAPAAPTPGALTPSAGAPAAAPQAGKQSSFPIITATSAAVTVTVSKIATGLDTPWALAFAPDGRIFVTERPGRLRVIENGALRAQPVVTLPVNELGEGGLLGLALDPQFPGQPFMYTMYTYNGAQGPVQKVVRLRLQGNTADEDRVLLDNIPASTNHDGGRLVIGPDGLLYVTVGDVGSGTTSQNPASLAGKILRLTRDGAPAAGNLAPGSYVYTLGHRNPEGLAFQPAGGRLYSTEHGPTGNDEINLIEAGQNYGWPNAQGTNHPAPYISPLITYNPAVAPAGAAFYTSTLIPQWQGSLFFGTLRGQHLHRMAFAANDPRRIVAEERLLEDQYGRLRDVVQGPDGALYVTTSNRDGRATPRPDDDVVLRLAPAGR